MSNVAARQRLNIAMPQDDDQVDHWSNLGRRSRGPDTVCRLFPSTGRQGVNGAPHRNKVFPAFDRTMSASHGATDRDDLQIPQILGSTPHCSPLASYYASNYKARPDVNIQYFVTCHASASMYPGLRFGYFVADLTTASANFQAQAQLWERAVKGHADDIL
jgi:hypothetical protein